VPVGVLGPHANERGMETCARVMRAFLLQRYRLRFRGAKPKP
jgi:hypothetical protein